MTLALTAVLVFQGLAPAEADSACVRASFLLRHQHLDESWFDSARVLVVDVRKRDPLSEAGLCLWTRVLLQMGDQAPTRGEKRRLYLRARAVADTLRRLNPMNPDGHMWWATAHGKVGQLEGVLKAAGIADDLKRTYEQVLELDLRYALAWYALGRLYAELPALFGGSLSRAEMYHRRGLAEDPNYTLVRLELARVLVRQKRRAEALRELERLLTTSRPTEPAEFVLDDRPAALDLLKSLGTGNK